VLPHSHELRYYLFWIIVLVALNLICVFSPRFAPASGSVARQVLAFSMLLTLACVVLMTRTTWPQPGRQFGAC
jgi:hypothetical protein